MTYFTYANYDALDGNWAKSYDWTEHTRRALAFQYGHERANSIIAGKDPETITDVARWNALGKPGEQAA